jgi:hypothetical protein
MSEVRIDIDGGTMRRVVERKLGANEIPQSAIEALYSAIEAAGFGRRRQEIVEDHDAFPEVRLELIYQGARSPAKFAIAVQNLAAQLKADI